MVQIAATTIYASNIDTRYFTGSEETILNVREFGEIIG
jgi:hypothetical protein